MGDSGQREGLVDGLGAADGTTATLIARRELNGARWEEIREAAAAEFNEVGYAAARLQDIARRLGLTAASLYHYIDGKEELLYEIIADSHRRGVANVMDTQVTSPGDACTRLRVLIVGWGQVAESVRYSVVERDLLFLSPAHRAEITAQRRIMHGVAREIIDQGIREGTFEDGLDAAVIANSLFSLLRSTRTWYRPDGPLSAREIYEWYADLFIRGLAPETIET